MSCVMSVMILAAVCVFVGWCITIVVKSWKEGREYEG
jgi:hypothetical protein